MAEVSSMAGNSCGAIARAEAEAPFLRAALARQPDLRAPLEAGEIGAALALARAVEGPALRGRLRCERDRIALCVAIGDLSG
ncbi:MAG: hypothetical protein H0X36_14115, partial [Sphingomonadaceae bacterium]|nr:hypothetical protein [Sphingomonadaceae bacterium]